MGQAKKEDFCVCCREVKPYSVVKKNVKERIRDKDYSFVITAYVCDCCHHEMGVPGVFDLNSREIDEQYRKAESIVSIEDIRDLMEIFNIGKTPLSLALGFGEITITRYLEGQVPSKEYSDVIRRALCSPSFMKEMLLKNREKIADSAFTKAMKAAENLEKAFTISDRMQGAIAYIFHTIDEAAPMALQTLLYYIEGVYSALSGKLMFSETCEAWRHGPVYRNVYNLFRDFRYNPADDARFAVLRGKKELLSDEERHAADLVLGTFGRYGGKALELIARKEDPWVRARQGYGPDESSGAEISNDSIREYFASVNRKYNLSSEEGLNHYISAMSGADTGGKP
ncbi:MAG: DUF4065 domain-containing protein [Succinivibrionaceae bacterium]|nr:DUF4065 domain-containing protein [Succinivibrionaceae bacterium]